MNLEDLLKKEQIPDTRNPVKKTTEFKKRRPWLEDVDIGQQDSITGILLDSNKTADKDSKSTAIRQQGESVKTANRQQLDSSSVVSVSSLDSNKTPDKTAGKTADRQQLDSNKTAKWVADSLSGKEADFIQIVFQKCQLSGSLVTEKIGSEILRERLKVSSKRLCNLVERLCEKQLIVVIASKRGNGSWRQFSLPSHVYQTMILNPLDSRSTAFRQHLDSNKTSDWTANKTAGASSSSSRDFFIKESTSTQPIADISTIDLSRAQRLGITTSVLARCIELYPSLQPEQLEGLVFRFAEFAKDPKNKVQNARGFFISLAEQASKGQVPLDHIETPDERLMRLFVEQQEVTKTQRVDFERKAQEFECETWLESLTPEMKLTLVPETAILRAGTAVHAAMLKSHFAEKVWPERRRQILQSANVNL
jgi:hypothetical protein